MEAGRLLCPVPTPWKNPKRPLSSTFPLFTVRASSKLQGSYRGPKPKRDLVADWVSSNDGAVRSLPIYVGGVSLMAVLFNRTVSGIAPVADASSILTGLVWLSIRPKTIAVVNLEGVECRRVYSGLPDFVVSELLWVWETLSLATCCRSLVVVYDCFCILQIGVAAESPSDNDDAITVDAHKLMQGSLYQGVMKSGAQSYLANLSLYPGKSELPFLPLNTQAVILQPLGTKGIAIIGGDTIRGFTGSDQAWITLIGEKLDASLSKFVISAG
ncbi:protein COFACTOR ASSEMBLY OF COMPLEX C SUBUNIT B CCB4, chloroplastic isoform X3 [Malania oleifera]|uniref:protein COFACTOR ASSEMBLY OF COMPLEX C SUBUNIT B CCB4, chloroplastic isoform X3 n=1 Tax=Malania oleifera TaxID=397392 RepID=UPI0025AE45C3|nr:protein COFACTOR ASSEMBLY OF COMPLEX C SUBUNIT B CCB4, chloroplastic isoform X3 [Malania oleifera]